MRLILKTEMGDALRRITGMVMHASVDPFPCISREIAGQRGKDSGEVSMALATRMKEITREYVLMHYMTDCSLPVSPFRVRAQRSDTS